MMPPTVPDESPLSRRATPSPWRRYVFLAVSAALVIAVMVAAREVMLPFVLAVVIAFVLLPLVEAVEARRVPRAVAIIVVYTVVLGSLGAFVRVVTPRVAQELVGLRRELPGLGHEIRDKWMPVLREKASELGVELSAEPAPVAARPHSAIVARPMPDGSIAVDIGSGVNITQTNYGYLLEPVQERKAEPFDPNHLIADAFGKAVAYAQNNALEAARIGGELVRGVSRFIFVFFITLMLAAYIMLTHERIVAFFLSLARPRARPSFLALLARVDRGLSGVVRGQLIICLVNGVLSALGFALVGLKYWPVLAIVATVFSLIPIFGSIVSSVPAVALGLTQSFGTAMFVLLWIVGIHQIEANLLNPKIMGDAAKIHPVLVVFSLLVGEHFFHTVGALLAVPCMSVAQSVFTHFRAVVQADDPELASEPVGSIMPPPL